MTDVGLIITMLREHKKWTRADLSRESGVSITTIKSVEMGTRECRVSTLEQMLSCMGYEMEILRIEDEPDK